MRSEIEGLLRDCPWQYVYDIIEEFYEHISQKEEFSLAINEYFQIKGIGWKLEKGQILFRGDDVLEQDLDEVRTVLKESSLNSSSNEINESILDLSKRPNADITGAIQHSIAALECVCRKITGDTNETLGTLIKNNSNIVPSPLDTVISKIWGYASENGRHIKEGKLPVFEEAELLVHLSSSLCIYLTKKYLK